MNSSVEPGRNVGCTMPSVPRQLEKPILSYLCRPGLCAGREVGSVDVGTGSATSLSLLRFARNDDVGSKSRHRSTDENIKPGR